MLNKLSSQEVIAIVTWVAIVSWVSLGAGASTARLRLAELVSLSGLADSPEARTLESLACAPKPHLLRCPKDRGLNQSVNWTGGLSRAMGIRQSI